MPVCQVWATYDKSMELTQDIVLVCRPPLHWTGQVPQAEAFQ